jgi:hypothetical protein
MAAEVTAFDAGFGRAERAEPGERWPAVAAVAAGALLLAVATGALVAPSAPAPFSHRLRVHEYFVANHDAALNQSLLVHGVAGVALLVLVIALWRAFAPGLARTLFLCSGVAAAAASFAQLDIVFRIESHIESGVGVRQTDALFDALNRACALKLGLLAVALAAALLLVTHSARAPRWVPWAGYALVAVLAVSAVALVTSVPSAHLLLTFVRP